MLIINQHNDTTDSVPLSISVIVCVRLITVRVQCADITITVERARTQFRPIPQVIHLRIISITSAKWKRNYFFVVS